MELYITGDPQNYVSTKTHLFLDSRKFVSTNLSVILVLRFLHFFSIFPPSCYNQIIQIVILSLLLFYIIGLYMFEPQNIMEDDGCGFRPDIIHCQSPGYDNSSQYPR